MSDALLSTWIEIVNETGEEYGVTLLVAGSIITGHLTPTLRYRDWLREVGRRASITRSRQRLPGGGIGPISEQQAARVRAEREGDDLLGGNAAAGGQYFCLRDAAVGRPGNDEGWTHLPFMVLRLDSVAGFSPVRLKA
jgi:hypothetical protein